MGLTKAVEYAKSKGVIITDRALRNAISEGRLIGVNTEPDDKKPYYVTTPADMDTFLLRRRRKNTRKTT